MNLSDVIIRNSWQARVLADGLHESEAVFLGQKSQQDFSDMDVVWAKKLILHSFGSSASLNTETGLGTTTTPSIAQVESVTVVAPSGATSTGDLTVILTGLDGPVAGPALSTNIQVALNTGAHLTAALVAAAIRTAIPNIATSAGWQVGGTGAEVTLTSLTPGAPNRPLANLSIVGGLGVSAVASSDTTVTSQAITQWINGPALDARGVPLPALSELVFCRIYVKTGSVAIQQLSSVWEMQPGNALELTDNNLPILEFIYLAGPVEVDIVFIGQKTL